MKKIKSTILFICLIVIYSLSFHISTQASNKEYVIDKATFTIGCGDNGDALVSEKWTVTFVSGEFNRFYKDIYTKNLSGVEDFSDIDVLHMSINGERNNNYSVTKSDDKITLEWQKPAKNETVEYYVEYIVKDAVKLTDDNKAVFCYRLIGNDFKHYIENVEVSILPINKEQYFDVTYFSYDYDSKISDTDNMLTISTNTRTNSMHKINIVMDASYFEQSKLQYIPLSNIQEQQKDKNIIEKIGDKIIDLIESLFPILVIGIFVGVYVVMAYRATKLASSYKRVLKKYKENPNEFSDCINRLQSSGCSPLVLKIHNKEKDLIYSNLTKIELSYLIHLGVLNLNNTSDKLILNEYSMDNLIFTDKESIEFIKGLIDLCGETGDEIEVQSILDALNGIYKPRLKTNNTKYINIEDLIDKTLIVKIRELKQKYDKNTQLYEDVEFINWYVNAFKIGTSEEERERVNTCNNLEFTDLIVIAALTTYCVPYVNKDVNKDKVCSILDLFEYMDYDTDKEYRLAHPQSSSSSSGCSSCSSCSSCSGCGGGGAD